MVPLHGAHLLQRRQAQIPGIGGVAEAAADELHGFEHVSAPEVVQPKRVLLIQEAESAHQCQRGATATALCTVRDAVLKQERRGQIDVTLSKLRMTATWHVVPLTAKTIDNAAPSPHQPRIPSVPASIHSS